jgi:dTDP-4-amino-4,6-dideoxygalactose transaminase
MNLPFYKPSIGPEEIAEVVDTLKSGWLTTGPKTKQFEKEFATYLNQKHAVAVNSCTAALHLALEAIGLKSGQSVLVPTMTFAATAEVVRYLGARPLLVDCRPEDFNLDINDAEQRIQSALAGGQEVAAIIPVHYGGQVGDTSGVQALAKRYNLKIIEDAAHCCPAYFRDKGATGRIPTLPPDRVNSGAQMAPVARPLDGGQGAALTQPVVLGTTRIEGNHSPSLEDRPGGRGSSLRLSPDWLPVGYAADISCFSFYANKTITTGEGGMACTNNDEYADRMRIMSLHGISRDAWKRYTAEGSWYYEIIAPGYKYNLTDIASAIGIHQLRKADAFHARRTELAGMYEQLLGDVDELIRPKVQPDRVHSWHLYVIRLKLSKLALDRAQFITELQRRGIGTSVHWMPLHMHPYYRQTYGYQPQDLPTASALYPELITLPLYPGMTGDDVAFVCDSIRQIIAANRVVVPGGLAPCVT